MHKLYEQGKITFAACFYRLTRTERFRLSIFGKVSHQFAFATMYVGSSEIRHCLYAHGKLHLFYFLYDNPPPLHGVTYTFPLLLTLSGAYSLILARLLFRHIELYNY